MYTPLGEEAFDKDRFLSGYSAVKGLEEIVSASSKGAVLPGKLVSLAGKILHNQEDFYFRVDNMPNLYEDSPDALKEGNAGIEKYVGKNIKEMLNLVPKEAYVEMIQRVKLNKVEGDEEHNELVSAQEGFNKFVDAAQDSSKATKYLSEQMKKAPKWAQAEFARMQGNERYVQAMMQAYGSYFQSNYLGRLHEEGFNAQAAFEKGLKGASKNKREYLRIIGEVAAKKLEA
jgi:hypothetical protein